MSYTISGKVKKIFETQEFKSGFSKRSFVITTDEKYPQDIQLDCLKEKAQMLENLNEKDAITVHFNISGREWNDRYFVNLEAWRIDSGTDASSPTAAVAEDEPVPEDTTDYGVENEDNIPF